MLALSVKEMKISKFDFFITIGVICIFSGIILVLYNFHENHEMEVSSQNINTILENKIIENIDDEFTDNDFLMASEEIDGFKYIGIVEIPSLNIKLPVMDSWSYEKLKISPVYYSGSYFYDNFVICAHNSKAHFGKVRNIKIGDEIHFTSVDGKVFKYIVSNTRVLKDTDVEDMIFNKDVNDSMEDWDLTLFTCTLDGKARFTVRALKA